MNPDQKQLLSRRLRFIRRWPLIAVIIALLTLGFYGWAFVKQPLLINPSAVLHLIQAPTPDTATLSLLAVIAPLLFLTVGGLILLLILFVTIGLLNEGRLIRALLTQKEPPEKSK